MKTKSIIFLLLCSLGISFTSCEDMLSPNSERHSYDIAQDTLYSYWGILKSLQNVGERYVILGECRGEMIDGTSYLSDTIKTILDFDMDNATDGSCRYLKASDYYHIINSCNAYLAKADTVRVTGTLQPYMMKEYAQVEAIRAWVYLQLVQVYGKVPFFTEPMLTTNDIDKYINNNDTYATADNLADLLIDKLTRAASIEKQYGFPSYESYGYTSTVCHSTKAMIPVSIILGDLYLTKGDPASCKKAAQYYYDYLGNYQGNGHIAAGGALPSGYNYFGYQGEGQDKPQYVAFGGGTPWTETAAQSSAKEAITAIPSSTNKLWGTVLRGVNELYGYDAEISVRTAGSDTASTTSASVTLTAQYDKKQLCASNAYFNLCKEQKFEEYVNSSSSDVTSGSVTPTVDPNIGDARQYWVMDVRQEYSNGVSNTEKFITKQNPNGQFTTVFPLIYRKSMIWLRFAEALNRAGYPSYAFAILKNGLCNNTTWYPDKDEYYAIKDSVYSVVIDEDTITEDSKDGLASTLSEKGYNIDSCEVIGGTVTNGYTNYPNPGLSSSIVLNYLDRREAVNPPSFLNFTFDSFDGNVSSQSLPYRTSLTQRNYNSASYTVLTDDNVTVGIHSHGCGILAYDESESQYNYVDQVIAKAKNYGYELTKEDIYSGEYDDIVKNCVEDLIVDEEGLELAFEGTRFFDLMRVAHRRSDPSYLANKLALRNSSLGSKLLNTKNWYFQLPKE